MAEITRADRKRASEIIKMLQAQLGHGSRKIIAEAIGIKVAYVSFAATNLKDNRHNTWYCPPDAIRKILLFPLKDAIFNQP